MAYRKICGLSQQAKAASMTLRQRQRRCGSLSTDFKTQIQALPLAELEALAWPDPCKLGDEFVHSWESTKPARSPYQGNNFDCRLQRRIHTP